MFLLGLNAFFRLHVGRVLGVTLFVGSLFLYESYQNRPVFGRWSYPFVAVIVAAIVLWAAVVRQAWTGSRRYRAFSEPEPLRAKLLDSAILFWGLAYLLCAIDDPASAGRITDLILVGSVMPAASLLEWVSLLLVFLTLVILVTPKLRGRWMKVGMAIGGLLVTILFAEGITRLKVAISPTVQGFPTYSSKAWGRRYERVNREGFRDVEHDLAAKPGVRRLLLVGDSFTWGGGIKRTEDRLGEQLMNRLQVTGQRWEVINAGKGDTHTLHHIGTVDRMLSYRPEVVLLVYVFNDIDYIRPTYSRDSPLLASVFDRLRPFWICYNNSYLFQEVFVRVRNIYYQLPGTALPDPYQDPTVLSRHLDDLGSLVRVASRTGALVRIVPFDNSIAGGLGGRLRYETFVRGAQERGLPVWSLERVFDEYTIEDLVINDLDAHANETANRLVADEVAKRLLQELNEL